MKVAARSLNASGLPEGKIGTGVRLWNEPLSLLPCRPYLEEVPIEQDWM